MKAYIIGKGESLANLSKEHFNDGIVIAINEAIQKVESLDLKNVIYSMQKDGASPDFRNNCPTNDCDNCYQHMVYPKKAILLLHEHESKFCLPKYKNRILFDNNEMGLEWSQFSAISAIRYAERLGATEFIMLCFDSITNNSNKSINNLNRGVMKRQDYIIAAPILLEELKNRKHKFIQP
tara:strand:- start:38 stop:577 length:540 start_codon:yes stop_codon:yes gene_type:complete